MRLCPELLSSKTDRRRFVPVSSRSRSVRISPRSRGRTARRLMVVLLVCVLTTGCSMFRRPGTSAGPRWGEPAPNVTSSRTKDTEGKSGFGSWFKSREREDPKTVNEWLSQTTTVVP